MIVSTTIKPWESIDWNAAEPVLRGAHSLPEKVRFLSFVGARSESTGDGNVEQTEIDRKLSAMMNGVLESAADHGEPRHLVNDLVASPESPDRFHVSVRRISERFDGLCD